MEEIDPLDAFMETISAEVAKTNHSETITANNNAAFNDDFDDEGEGEDEESSGKNGITSEALKNLSAEEVIALAQKQARRKDLGSVDHKEIAYTSFRKDFYVESPEIKRMTKEEVESYRKELDGIKIRGQHCPRPIRKWTHCGLNQKILDTIKRLGYERPTPIQAQAIPAVMSGRDLIGIAKTGSGKTISFLLPLFRHALDQPKLAINDGPIALIMTPTRELAMQIYTDCRKFAAVLGLGVVCAYGGAPIKEQIADLKRGAEVLISTPGRLIDLLMANSGKVTNLKRVTYLVLDEADRMFDMGFGPQVQRIIGNVRPDRQAVFFSATFPQTMEALARKYLNKPLEIVVGARSTVSSDIEQLVEVVPEDSKFLKLLDVLGRWYETKSSRILIFVDRQDSADSLLKDLTRRGYHCQSLHGGKDQADRECAIADFKNGIIPILIATSVAARGLDVKDLKLVINYECPNHMEDYVHRVGRTGRAGRKGTAITFVTPGQERYAAEIVKALTASGAPIPTALQLLSDSFSGKLKTGNVQNIGSGFGGKGLERMDQEHERARKTQKFLMGGEEAGLSSDEEEELISLTLNKSVEPKKPKMIPQSAPSATAETVPSSLDGGSAKESKRTESPSATSSPAATLTPPITKMTPSLLAALQKINEKVSFAAATSTEFVEEASDPLAILNARYKTTTPSSNSKQSSEIMAVYDRPSVPGGQPIAKSFWAEMEVNDYPQAARFKITHKDTLTVIMDYSNALIVVKGEYVAAGKPPREGQRKLYLRIDSETSLGVERALKELRRVLFESVTEAVERGTLDSSRYNI